MDGRSDDKPIVDGGVNDNEWLNGTLWRSSGLSATHKERKEVFIYGTKEVGGTFLWKN